MLNEVFLMFIKIAFLLLTLFKILWRTPCQLLAYPQGYAYPRLRTAGVSDSSYYTNIHKINKLKVAKWGTPKNFFKNKTKININNNKIKQTLTATSFKKHNQLASTKIIKRKQEQETQTNRKNKHLQQQET
jgi:hypothetical protein